jgi:hypothetical protein
MRFQANLQIWDYFSRSANQYAHIWPRRCDPSSVASIRLALRLQNTACKIPLAKYRLQNKRLQNKRFVRPKFSHVLPQQGHSYERASIPFLHLIPRFSDHLKL